MPFGKHIPVPKREKISVDFLVRQIQKSVNIAIEPCVNGGNCENRYVTEQELHRPGLALTGYLEHFTFQRIQILGNTECNYLHEMTPGQQREAFHHLIKHDVPVIFLTNGNTISEQLMAMAADAGIPVFRSPIETTRFMFLLRDFLDDQFALQTVIHASMVDVYGIGILIAGKSGIGKSELALDLVERGHRLVADDVVIVTKKNNILIAAATEMSKHFMEIRGLGIVDVMSMFGIRSVRYQKRVEVVVDLFLWDEKETINRTGLEHEEVSILDVSIPIIHLPITPGKNITVIAEVIAMNHLLSHYGYDAAKAFQEKLKKKIASKTGNDKGLRRAIDYFEGDFE
jgi:HPr kinase/phosphorylase